LDVSGALIVLPIVALLILAAIPAVAVVVLWKWLGDRQKPPGPPA
jgi:hypothetical protein